MSLLVYPSLPGLTFSWIKRPKWNGLIQTHSTGKEMRLNQYSNVLYEWEVTYSLLRMGQKGGQAFDELQTLIGFYNIMNGPTNPFLFEDPDDNTVSQQYLGDLASLDSYTNVTFTLVRTFGSTRYGDISTDPIGMINLNNPVLVFLNGINILPNDTTYGWTINNSIPGNNTITFNNVPTTGNANISMSYYYYTKFNDTKLQFEKFFTDYWDIKTVTIEQLRSEYQQGTEIIYS